MERLFSSVELAALTGPPRQTEGNCGKLTLLLPEVLVVGRVNKIGSL